MKYFIYDRSKDNRAEYEDWWSLVGAFYDGQNRYWGEVRRVDYIAHNENDIISEWDYKFNRRPDENVDYDEIIVEKAKSYLTDSHSLHYIPNNNRVYMRHVMVYDEYDRIINKREIEDALKVYKPRPTKRRRYAYWHGFNGKKRCWSWGRNAKWNKNYSAQLQEYVDLFPSDGRLRRDIARVSMGWDIEPRHSTQKSWKWQSKKRKQWM